MTGKVLERGQNAFGVHATDVCASVIGDQRRAGTEAPRRADNHGIRGVVAHVDHRGQVPVDTGLVEHAPDASRLQLGHGEIVGVAEVLVGRGWRVARVGSQAHDLPALGIGRDEQGATGTGAAHPARLAREASNLGGIGDVSRKQDDASHLDPTQKILELPVALGLGSLEPDEHQPAKIRGRGGAALTLAREGRLAGRDEEGNAEDNGAASRGQVPRANAPPARHPPTGARVPRRWGSRCVPRA